MYICSLNHKIHDYGLQRPLPRTLFRACLQAGCHSGRENGIYKECTRLAPSAVNRQPWKFILFTGEDDRARLQQCYDKEWFREAPAYILVCENHGAAWTRRYDEKNHADIDVAIAIEHLCLAAAEQGLGTCWVCNFRVQLCQELFNLPDEWYPAAIIPIGYPATPAIPEKTRKAMAEIWEDR